MRRPRVPLRALTEYMFETDCAHFSSVFSRDVEPTSLSYSSCHACLRAGLRRRVDLDVADCQITQGSSIEKWPLSTGWYRCRPSSVQIISR
jgi:hypothetical protein